MSPRLSDNDVGVPLPDAHGVVPRPVRTELCPGGGEAEEGGIRAFRPERRFSILSSMCGFRGGGGDIRSRVASLRDAKATELES